MWKKIVFFFVLSVVIIYPINPFIHECGHIIATLLVGGEVMELSMGFPPYVISNIAHVSPVGNYIISVSGSLLPCLFGLIPYDRNYITKAIRLLFCVCGMTGCVVSIAIAVLYRFGIYTSNSDDIVQAMKIHPDPFVILLVFGIPLLFLARYVIRENPIKECADIISASI